jgi:hypothetical protein
MSAVSRKPDINWRLADIRFVPDIREMACVKKKDRLAAVSPKSVRYFDQTAAITAASPRRQSETASSDFVPN